MSEQYIQDHKSNFIHAEENPLNEEFKNPFKSNYEEEFHAEQTFKPT